MPWLDQVSLTRLAKPGGRGDPSGDVRSAVVVAGFSSEKDAHRNVGREDVGFEGRRRTRVVLQEPLELAKRFTVRGIGNKGRETNYKKLVIPKRAVGPIDLRRPTGLHRGSDEEVSMGVLLDLP